MEKYRKKSIVVEAEQWNPDILAKPSIGKPDIFEATYEKIE